jgi:hypothetical protein
MAYQLGLTDDVCNFIGTKDERNSVMERVQHVDCTGDGNLNHMVYGAWLYVLLLYILATVIVHRVTIMDGVRQITSAARQGVNTITETASKAASGVQDSISAKPGGFLPTRYSRIRVTTGV